MRFYIVDVFAETKYAGNQLAVVRDAGTLTADLMQSIALEMNYSETTFLLSDEPSHGGFNVRIFTPRAEVPFAGHPTLGTAFVIREELLGGDATEVSLNLKVGQIPVSFESSEAGSDVLWMTQQPPSFGRILEPGSVAEVLGVDVGDVDSRFPVQEVSTGLPCTIVPLRSLRAVEESRVDRRSYDRLAQEGRLDSLYLFCAETADSSNAIHARLFADAWGVPEDPATGSAAGCLAGYLAYHRYFGESSVAVNIEQGLEMNRPSLLRVRAEPEAEQIRVRVGGRVMMVARGHLV